MDFVTSIVRILNTSGQSVGTGFVLTDEGLIATCAHVIETAGGAPGDTLEIVFHHSGEEAIAIVDPDSWCDPQAEDVAILHLKAPLPKGIAPLPLRNSTGATGQTFHTFGFPNTKPVEGMAGKCEIVGRTTEGGFPVLQLRSSEITLGFSGAPVWDELQHAVIGLIVSITRPDSYGRMSETAFIIPVETLRKICPELRLPELCPYRGLEIFEVDHADYYFGREAAIRELLHLLSLRDFVAVVGVSGSGKSSLVQAGLAKGLQTWSVPGLVERPHCLFAPGNTPLLNLILALAGLPKQNIKRLAKSFNIQMQALMKEGDARRKANEALNTQSPKTLAMVLRNLSQSKGLLLIVDQFERLYTECQDEVIRNQFIDTLLLTAGDKIKIILTLRADFYAQALAHTGLAHVIKDNQMILLPMTEMELRQAIVEPAKTLHRGFQPGLVEQLIADVRGRAGDLPLLEFTLTELWECDAESGILTLASYEKLGYDSPDGEHFPGLQGAIAQRAEEVWQNLSEADQQAAKRIFLGLITPGVVHESGKKMMEDTSRRAWQAELDKRAQQVVEQLVAARLLTTGKDPLSEQPTVEVAHEALIRAWPRLQQWLANYHPFVRWYNSELAPFLHRWLDLGRHSDFLLPKTMLTQAQHWLGQYPDDLSGSPAEYIQASLQKWEQEQAAQERVRRWFTVAAVGAAIVFLVLALLALGQRNEAERQRVEAEAAQATSEARRAEADKQRQLAVARQLAAQSQLALDNTGAGLVRSALLAIESLRRSVTFEGDQAIRRGLDLLPRSMVRMMHEGVVVDIDLSLDGKWLATGSRDGTARVWETATGREVIRVNPEAQIETVTLSPDGRWLVTGSGDTIRVWNAATGKELTRRVHDSLVDAIAFSPDSKWLATGNLDGAVRLWETATSREVPLIGHQDEVRAVTFSPDSKWLASGSWDGSARVWEVASGKEVAHIMHEDGLLTIAFSPDGKRIATGSLDGIVQVWDVTTGKEVARMAHYGSVKTVIFSHDGKWLATGAGNYDNSARVWEAATGREVARMKHDGGVQALAFSSDDRWLATGSLDNTARIWDAVTGEEVARMAHEGLPQFVSVLFGPSLSGLMIEPYRMSPVGGVSAIAFSPDGNRLATGSWDNTAQVWQAVAGQEVARIALDLDDAVGAVDFSPDSRWLLTNSGVFTAPTGNEQLWDVTTGQEVALLPYGDLQNITFSPDGKWLASVSWGEPVQIWEATTRRKAAQLADKDNVTAIAFSPNSNWLATVSRDNTIRIWELASRREVVRILNAGEVWDINFSSSSRWLITRGNYGSATRVWEVATGREITLPAPEGKIAAVSPDGKWLATRNSYNTVQVWEAATGREVARIELDFKNSVDTIIFSPDSKWLLIEDSWKEGMVQVREAATGREVARIEKDPGKDTPSGLTYVSSIFSPNSRWIAIKNWDSVLLWEAPTGRKVAQLVHEEEVLDMIFSPDSKWLATGSADHTVRVWCYRPNYLIKNEQNLDRINGSPPRAGEALTGLGQIKWSDPRASAG